MAKILETRIQHKSDTEANWILKNPILLLGEIGLSSDRMGMFKVGNGTSVWGQLNYNQIEWTSISGKPNSMKNPNALTMQFNGVVNKTYDGSSAQTLNVTPSTIGAAPSTHSHTKSQITDLPASISTNITIPSAGWSASAPYTQTVNVAGITAQMDVFLSLNISSSATAEQVKNWEKALSMVGSGNTANGSIVFKCYSKKPTIDIPAHVKSI